MVRYLPAFLAIFLLGCDQPLDPQQVLKSSQVKTAEVEQQLEATRKSTAEAQQAFEESVKSSRLADQSWRHPGEVVAEQFVAALSQEALPAESPTVARLSNLDDAQRDEAYRTLHKYLQAQQWNLWFTTLVVSDGKDDVVTCFFRSTTQGSLVVMLAYHGQAWIVSAYETPELRYARSADETLDQYVAKMVADVQAQGLPLEEGPQTDGLYFIQR